MILIFNKYLFYFNFVARVAVVGVKILYYPNVFGEVFSLLLVFLSSFVSS